MHRKRKKTKEMQTVDLIASGYEWTCPECGNLHHEIEANGPVVCDCCKKVFETNPPEHAIG